MSNPAPVQAYLDREAAENKTMRGADHSKILSDVAAEHGINPTALRSMVLDHTIQGPC